MKQNTVIFPGLHWYLHTVAPFTTDWMCQIELNLAQKPYSSYPWIRPVMIKCFSNVVKWFRTAKALTEDSEGGHSWGNLLWPNSVPVVLWEWGPLYIKLIHRTFYMYSNVCHLGGIQLKLYFIIDSSAHHFLSILFYIVREHLKMYFTTFWARALSSFVLCNYKSQTPTYLVY